MEPEPRPPSLAFWLLHLFFQPRRFFQHFPKMATGFTVFYTTWTVGIMEVIFQIDDSASGADGASGASLFEDILQSWGVYWAFCLTVGLVAGALTWNLGGWWYRMRLRLSGHENPGHELARRVYIFAAFILAFPAVIIRGIDTVRYAMPLYCEIGESWSWAIWLVFPLWSIYASYRGVRTLFNVRLWPARLWFAILPTAFFGSIIVGATVAAALTGGPEPPDLSNWETISRSGFRLRYPANWWVNDDEEAYDRDHYFTIEPMQFALVTFHFRDEPSDPAKQSAAAFEHQKKTFEGVGHKSFGEWAGHSGAGIEYIGAEEGAAYRIRIFSASSSTRSFTVVEWAYMYDEDVVEPGFQMIRDSFVLKD
ncbi:MAG: hypothetical protein V3W34_05135 [Phycisphaerae bacterium]